MPLWDCVWRRRERRDGGGPLREDAGRLERDGKLEEALQAYEEAGLASDAARVAVALADVETDPRARVKLLGRAARIPGAEPSLRARHAKARLDLAKTSAGAALPSELVLLGQELEEMEEAACAAEAYRLAGDRAAEARALAAAGEIDGLEQALESDLAAERRRRVERLSLGDVEALEAGGQRAVALAKAEALARESPSDEHVRRLVSSIARRLVRGERVRLDVRGDVATWVLGDEAIVGRVDADVVVSSPVASRRHLRFARNADGEVVVEDLATRNGTFAFGARLAAPIVVRDPLIVTLGGEVPCAITPIDDGGVAVEIAGARHRLPLGTARIGSWRLEARNGTIRLVVPEGAPPPLLGGTVAAAEGLDLAIGDAIAEARGAPAVLRVLG